MRHVTTLWVAVLVMWANAGLFAQTPMPDNVIEGAKKEGKLVVYTSMTADQAQKILDAFKAKYSFIQTSMFRAVGERLLTKIMTETQAGKYEFDAVQSAESQAYFLKKKNLLLNMFLQRSKTSQNRSLIRKVIGQRCTSCPMSSATTPGWSSEVKYPNPTRIC
jgi:hypothetical protein